jgi:hypothetical protein
MALDLKEMRMSEFGRRIRPHVEREIRAAREAESRGQPNVAFSHLERAHILGQASTLQHVRAHWHMLRWSVRQRNIREGLGQTLRIVGAALSTALGLVPQGNTGGSNVNPFRSMPLPPELASRIKEVRTSEK